MAVTVETDKRDRYGRNLGKVLIDGKDANLMQIEHGMAWWYRAYKKDQSASDRVLYEAAEATAKTKKVGLCTDAKPVPPWDFRRQQAH